MSFGVFRQRPPHHLFLPRPWIATVPPAGLSAAQTETAAATDAQTATVVMNAAQAESSAATDSQTASAVMAAIAAESAASSETQTATMAATVAQAESIAATEAQDGVIAAGDVNAARIESVAVSDASTSLYTILASLTESAALAESANRTAIMNRLMEESIAAGESTNRTAAMTASIIEACTVLDLATAQLMLFALRTETVGITHSSDGGITLELTAACLELIAILDHPIGMLIRDETFEDRLFMAVQKVYTTGQGSLPDRLKLDRGFFDRLKGRL